MWPKNGPITSQIVKVIHDDSYKQVDDLKPGHEALFSICISLYTAMCMLRSVSKHYCCWILKDYQKSTEHVEADEVDDGEAAAAGSFLSGVVVGLRITQLSWQTGQHDLLPGLTGGTPNIQQQPGNINTAAE